LNLNSNSGRQDIVSREFYNSAADQGGYNLQYRGDLTPKRIRFVTRNNASTASQYNYDATGEWIHIAGVYNGTHNILYINGTQEDSDSSVGIRSASGSNLTISDYTFTVNGSIDEVRFYDKALTQEEIQAITSTSSSLVSHWKFDEGTGPTASDSEGSNEGTITGASWITGLLGGALDFDGSGDYVNVGNDDSLEIDITNSNVTISAWVYPKVLDNYEPVFAADDYDGAYYGYMLMITPDGYVWLTYGDGTGAGSNNRRTKTGTTSLQTNTWYHVVGIIRGATDMSIFINGIDDGGTYSGTGGDVSYSSASASIGRVRFGTLDNEFNGSIDEVMVFNRELTEGEVRLLPVLLKRGIPLP